MNFFLIPSMTDSEISFEFPYSFVVENVANQTHPFVDVESAITFSFWRHNTCRFLSSTIKIYYLLMNVIQ